MRPGLGASVATFPAAGTPDYATSGLTIGVDSLAGTSALVDEAIGRGTGRPVLCRPELPGLDPGHPAAPVECDHWA